MGKQKQKPLNVKRPDVCDELRKACDIPRDPYAGDAERSYLTLTELMAILETIRRLKAGV